MEYIYRKMSLDYASLLHVLSQPISLFNFARLDKRLDDDLITSARRADVSLLARPTHACTCYYKFPGNQGRGQPVWSWAAATIVNLIQNARRLFSMTTLFCELRWLSLNSMTDDVETGG